MIAMTTPIKIDATEALRLIDKAVDERGKDWTYPATGECRYFYDPEDYQRHEYDDDEEMPMGYKKMVAYFGDDGIKPACLVGYAIHDLDERLDPLFIDRNSDAIDDILYPNGENGEATIGAEDARYTFTAAARKVFSAAQEAQDSGLTWGTARDRAYDAAASAR